MTLADRIFVLLIERGPLSACVIAIELRRRKTDVLRELREDRRFAQVGRGRSSRYDVCSVTSETFLELHPDWSSSDAEQVVRWLVESGFTRSLNGPTGPWVVTERGLEESLSFRGARR